MEINALNKNVPSFTKTPVRVKQLRETVETIVPEKNKDVAKIAAVSAYTELKGKESFGNRLTLSFDVCADIICLSENCTAPEKLSVRKTIEAEFECDSPVQEKLSHVELSMTNYEARLINPRKTAIMFEIEAKLYQYEERNFPVNISVPETENAVLHKKVSERDVLIISEISEKQFVVVGQHTTENTELTDILCCEHHLSIEENDCIGTKTVIKGKAVFDLLCLCNEKTEKIIFTVPFSQVLDCGSESVIHVEVLPQINSRFISVSESISGGKSIEAELHVLIQYRAYRKEQIAYVEDVYCNTWKTVVEKQQLKVCTGKEQTRKTLQADGKISLPDDCSNPVLINPKVSNFLFEDGKIKAEINVDIIYLTSDGDAGSIRRPVLAEAVAETMRTDITIQVLGYKLNGDNVTFDFETIADEETDEEVNYINSIKSDEEIDFDLLPCFSVVRKDNETLWELAKCCSSSVEAIKEYNEGEIIAGQMVLIPKTK